MAGATGLEPATSGVTGRRSNQLSYAPGPRALVPEQGLLVPSAKGVKYTTRRRYTLWVGVVGDEGFEPPTPSV